MTVWRARAAHACLALGLVAVGQPWSLSHPRASRSDLSLASVVPTNTIEALVPADSTLEALLEQAQLSTAVSASIVTAARAVFNPRELHANRPYSITRTLDGLFQEFRYEIDADNVLRVVFHDGGDDRASSFDAAVIAIPKDFRPAAVSVTISRDHRSIVDAFSAKGENIQLPLELADVFGGQLDFNADLKVGDRVDVLFDRAVRHGQFVGYGDVRVAVLHHGSRPLTAIRFVGQDGQAGWYDERGQSLKRQFLRSPLPFDPRVTSGFSSSRLHPILGVARPHLGVDFSAPYGTAVKAVAAGVIETAAPAGEAGRMVRIRHADGYETAYLHLSSFAPGIYPGVRVEQGQLIGRVGQSGLATGPHLDYRVIRKGVYVNPLTAFAHTTPGGPITGAAVGEFSQERDRALQDLRARLAAPDETQPAP